MLKKYVEPTSQVALGRDRFPVDLNAIIDIASKIVGKVEKPAPKTYSIAHLKSVRDSYNARDEEIDKEMVVTNLLFRIPMVLSALGGVVTGIAKASGMEVVGNLSLVFTIVSVVVLIYGSYKNVSSG